MTAVLQKFCLQKNKIKITTITTNQSASNSLAKLMLPVKDQKVSKIVEKDD